MNIPELIMIVAPNVGLLDETIRVGAESLYGNFGGRDIFRSDKTTKNIYTPH